MDMAFLIIGLFILFCIFIFAVSKHKETISPTKQENSEVIVKDYPTTNIVVEKEKIISKKQKHTQEYFNKIQSEKSIDRLYLYPNKKVQPNNSGFYKKKVTFTGDLNSFSRNEIASKLWELGADIDTGLSSKTEIVIVGENPGYVKIQEVLKQKESLGLKIIYEPELLNMLEVGNDEVSLYNDYFKKSIVIFGEYEFCSSDKVFRFLIAQHASIVDNIDRETDIVIIGSATLKTEKLRIIEQCKSNGISVIEEEELLPYLENF